MCENQILWTFFSGKLDVKKLKPKEKEKHKVTYKECLLKYAAMTNLFPLKI